DRLPGGTRASLRGAVGGHAPVVRRSQPNAGERARARQGAATSPNLPRDRPLGRRIAGCDLLPERHPSPHEHADDPRRGGPPAASLELASSRIAHIMRMSRRLEYERLAERRRQRALTNERQRIAREVHDEVGQALSGLLVHLRYAVTKGQASPEELQLMERAARSAMDGARALAYGFRNLQRGIGALEGARSFADTLLRAARCNLSWIEERTEVAVPGRTL